MVPREAYPLRPVTYWLISGCILIACMVLIGGITRLTGSGLSITGHLVDVSKLQLGPIPGSPQRQPSDPAKTVNRNFYHKDL